MEASHRRELATQGWTVLRGHLPTGLTSRLRAVADSVLGGPAPVRCVAERGIAAYCALQCDSDNDCGQATCQSVPGVAGQVKVCVYGS